VICNSLQDYSKGVKKVPSACITIEDAEMLSRMQKRGTKIVIKLYMEAKTLPDEESRNVVAEIVGSKYPEQVSFNLHKKQRRRKTVFNMVKLEWKQEYRPVKMCNRDLHVASTILLAASKFQYF
jgi:hypothetical protein